MSAFICLHGSRSDTPMHCQHHSLYSI